MEESIEDVLNEIRARIKLLQSCLPKSVDAMAVTATAKIPFKVVYFREAMIWRMEELSRSALESLENNKLGSATCLTRAAVETSAALWYLWGKIKTALENGSVGNFDNYMMRLSMGSKNDPNLPDPINVLTFVQHVNEDIEGFEESYNSLSEYAHPNWAGVKYLYSKFDKKNLIADFGGNPLGNNGTKSLGAFTLVTVLSMFEFSYNQIGEHIKDFINLCERSIMSDGGKD